MDKEVIKEQASQAGRSLTVHLKNFITNLKQAIAPMHRDGWPFIVVAVLVTVLIGTISSLLFWIGVAITIWVYAFFRNPERVAPERDDMIVAASDGKVISVEEGVAYPVEFKNAPAGSCTQVSVFLNIFDVHINRSPIAGKVIEYIYVPSEKIIQATEDKADEANERALTLIENESGVVAVSQIAGMIARRVVNSVKEESTLSQGQEIGLIRFGSRVDLYIPKEFECLVKPGQSMVGGETPVALLVEK